MGDRRVGQNAVAEVENMRAGGKRREHSIDFPVERLAALGAEVALSTPEELAKFQATETAKWSGVIKRAGIVPE